MAGSFKHCLDAFGNYRGTGLLSGEKDLKEALEQTTFMLLLIRQDYGKEVIEHAENDYFECIRKERPWPFFFMEKHRDG